MYKFRGFDNPSDPTVKRTMFGNDEFTVGKNYEAETVEHDGIINMKDGEGYRFYVDPVFFDKIED